MIRLALALSVLTASTAFAAPSPPTSYAFGRTGGSIRPFTVSISASGAVRAAGAVQVQKRQVTARALAKIAAVVKAERFASLPAATRCPGTLPDIASQFVTVRTGAPKRTVLVHGGCSPRFAAVFEALSRAVGLPK